MEMYITWKGLEYNSIEECRVTTNETTIEINSMINGTFQESLFSLKYKIITNLSWETLEFMMDSKINEQARRISYVKDVQGNWLEDGKQLKEFSGCIDIDIPLTPLTNSLPINRLNLSTNEEAQIKVLYIDVLARTEKVMNQKYKRLTTNLYQYENVPNDFEGIVSVDQEGFVINYPGLFQRAS